MKSAPYPANTSTWQPSVLEPPSKFQKTTATSAAATLKMKSTKTRKRPSPKHTPLPPLPSISTLFESGSSSHSSSSNSSYGSYCQFSPEGSYTMYHWPMNYFPYVPETSTASIVAPMMSMTTASTSTATSTSTDASPPVAPVEHKPFDQPLFIQTTDPYDPYTGATESSYPSSATINASQLLLRPVPNGQF